MMKLWVEKTSWSKTEGLTRYTLRSDLVATGACAKLNQVTIDRLTEKR
jgi:hypothetical protein